MNRATVLCRWPGCREVIRAGFAFCRPHHAGLPLRIQRALQQASEPQDKAAALEVALRWARGDREAIEAPAPFSEPRSGD